MTKLHLKKKKKKYSFVKYINLERNYLPVYK